MLVLSLLCILPGVVVSQGTTRPVLGNLEFGLGYNSEDSYKFGEYTGLKDNGIFALGSIDLSSVFPYDTDNNHYWKLSGSNLGLDSRQLYAEYGNQGKFSFFLDYHQLNQNRFNDAKTPFTGAGTNDQSLPGNWIAANSTSGFSNLFSSLNTHTIETERQRLGAGFSWLFSRNWELVGKYRHEIKDGGSPIAGIFATNGGNPRSSLLIAPVDYNTDSMDVSLSYTGQTAQFTLAYYLSVFNNVNQSLRWDNPYLRPTGNTWAPGTDFAAGARGQLALPPDNQSQQFTFSGGYRLGSTTRITTNLSYGWMEQNDPYLPYTINSSLNVPVDLPRTNLDSRIETLHFTLGLSVRPLRKLNIRANYSYDDRDNKTPRDFYQLVLNDSGNQGGLVSSGTRLNTPYSFSTQRLELEAGYRLMQASKLSMGYKYEQRDRDFSEVASTDEHAGWINLSSSLSAMVTGWIKFIHSERSGSTYVSNQPFLDGHNPDYISTLAADERFINDPLLRKFSYADRNRDEVIAAINIMPIVPLSFSVTGRYGNDDYNNSSIGQRERQDTSITLDAAYSPNKLLTAHAFVTREDLEYTQQGYQRANVTLYPGVDRDPAPCASCGFWQAKTDDGATTVGAGLDRRLIENKLNLKINYIYSRSVTDIILDADSTVAFAPLPKIKSKLHNFTISAEYQLRENIAIRLRYLYEHFDLDDFASDGIEVDTLSNVLSLGTGSLDYDAHVFGLSLVYQLR